MVFVVLLTRDFIFCYKTVVLRKYVFKISTWIIIYSMLNSFFAISQSSTYSKTLDLDGSSSFIEIPTSTDLKFDSDKFTLEAWIKIENGPSSGSKDYIFRKKNDWSLAIENIIQTLNHYYLNAKHCKCICLDFLFF